MQLSTFYTKKVFYPSLISKKLFTLIVVLGGTEITDWGTEISLAKFKWANFFGCNFSISTSSLCKNTEMEVPLGAGTDVRHETMQFRRFNPFRLLAFIFNALV